MSIDVADVTHKVGDSHDVSGSAVHILMGLVHAHRGEAGVVQVLALAEDHRPFAELADPTRWSSLTRTVALLNAAALVTGDGAIGFHVGQVLLFAPDGRQFADRLRALGSTGGVMEKVGGVLGHFEATSATTTLELAGDHALVEVAPRRPEQPRHAHLCEMTRGVLSQIPALFDRPPALITETECSARGGRRCLYAISWEAQDAEPEGLASRPAGAGAGRGRRRGVGAGRNRRGAAGFGCPPS